MTTKSPYREAPEAPAAAATAADVETLARTYLAGFQMKSRDDVSSYPWGLSGAAGEQVIGAVLCYVLANKIRLEGIEERLTRIEQTLARIERNSER